MSADQPVTTVVETLEEATAADETCLRDILSEFGAASFPSILLIVSLMLVSPLSGVPLLTSFIGVIIFLVAGQGVLGRRHIWLPGRLVAWKMNTQRSERALERIRRIAAWLDRAPVK
ncbi:MAG: exopolysaccharide biosynthesis protein, partial [Pseudomonadota bacterium]